ncbi:BON domain-containing protein [Methylomagnum sp.]
MKTIGKVNNTDESMTEASLRNFNRKAFTMPKRLGLLTVVLMAGLMPTVGNIRAEPAIPPLAANSELENTERNTRDSDDATLTPEDQKETKADVKITTAIRQTIVKNKSLSLDAHNAKIITRNGVVTLRGPVKNDAEKNKLQSIAQKTRGVKQVDNQLEAKTP